MVKPIIRTEVQATPTISLLGKEAYAWKIYIILSGAKITLQSGFEYSLVEASQEALDAVRKYI